MKAKIAIVDYGMGNIRSLTNALLATGKCEVIVSRDRKVLENSDGLFLPGVGAFPLAMKSLIDSDLVEVIKDLTVTKKKPLMAICLGMQLLFDSSDEWSLTSGLGLLKGDIKKFNIDKSFRIPHIGWNSINIVKQDSVLLKDIENLSDVYFLHSFQLASSNETCVATCNYGVDFGAVVEKDNIFATQFHPEKSQEIGLKILNNYIDFVLAN